MVSGFGCGHANDDAKFYFAVILVVQVIPDSDISL